MSEDKDINDYYNDLLNKLVQANEYIIELQQRIIKARDYLLRDIDEKEISYWQRSELFKILGDKE